MRLRLFLSGPTIWIAGTVIMRLEGQSLIHPGDWKRTLVLFGATFPLVAWLVRGLCRWSGLDEQKWLPGAVLILLPTLVLDPFSSAFFPLAFPNMPPEAAGIFGGWMLWCCAAGLIGVSLRWKPRG